MGVVGLGNAVAAVFKGEPDQCLCDVGIIHTKYFFQYEANRACRFQLDVSVRVGQGRLPESMALLTTDARATVLTRMTVAPSSSMG